jgi:hypothetical protein
LSILWQQGLGSSALQTGLLVLPFAVASLSTASNSYRFSARFGRKTVHCATAWSSRRTRTSCSARCRGAGRHGRRRADHGQRIGTALFGSGSGHSGSAKLMPSLTHTTRWATVLSLAFVLAAWLCTFGLPKTLAAERAEGKHLTEQARIAAAGHG